MTQPERDPNETAPFSSPLNQPWAFYGDIPEKALQSVELGAQDEWETQLWTASELLYALSGRRWRGAGGERTLTVRSVRPRPADGAAWPWHPSWGVCRCWAWSTWGPDQGVPIPGPYDGRHLSPRAVKLPDGDVTAVTAVSIDGAALDPEAWRFDETSGWLQRLDGRRWPVCSGALDVTYRFGHNPPRSGVKFAAELAVDYARYAVGDEKCRLPSRITSVTRQAISMTFSSPEEVAKSRLTGVPVIDSWITSVNPYLRPAEAFVVSPDVPTARSY